MHREVSSQTFFFVLLFSFTGKGSIDKANEEIRNIILRIWPKTSMELLNKVVQPPGGGKLTETVS